MNVNLETQIQLLKEYLQNLEILIQEECVKYEKYERSNLLQEMKICDDTIKHLYGIYQINLRKYKSYKKSVKRGNVSNVVLTI
jgi:hypothetical protein